MKPLISVIVPIYKVEEYLERCVDSILTQTYSNLEIILVDDGSPDNCGHICDKYAETDERVRVIHQENGGLPAARNAGLNVATGEYIGFVDSDDFIEAKMFEVLLNCLLENKVDIVQCGITNSEAKEYVNNADIHELLICNQKEAIIHLLSSDEVVTCSVWNKLYKAELFSQLRFPNVRSEDFGLNYYMFKRISKIAVIDTPLYHYVLRGNSITTGKLRESHFDFIDMIHVMSEDEEEESLYPYWRIQKAITARNFLIPIILSNQFVERYSMLRKDMVGAKFVLWNRKYSVEIKMKLHILVMWLCPVLYNSYIKWSHKPLKKKQG